MPTVDFFFSFRSPYSYLAGPRAFRLPERFNIELVYRGVRPMVTRGVPLPAVKRLYILTDAKREADWLGMPFGNIFDPLGEGALRCLHVAEYAAELRVAPAFVLAASRAIWAEGRDVAEDDVLRRLCDGAGLDWAGCRQAVEDPRFRARIEENARLLGELGQWGVPTFVFQGEAFWGQDRIVDLERALGDAGLARASATEVA